MDESPQIEMTLAAVSALRARGGNLYLWAEGAGLLRVRANPPRKSISYDTFSSNGCSIHVDQGIKPASRWLISGRGCPGRISRLSTIRQGPIRSTASSTGSPTSPGVSGLTRTGLLQLRLGECSGITRSPRLDGSCGASDNGAMTAHAP